MLGITENKTKNDQFFKISKNRILNNDYNAEQYC